MSKYGDYIRLNKNVLLGMVAALTISAAAAQALGEEEYHLNATYILMVDYLVYYTTFGSLYYRDHKDRYRTQEGRLDRRALKKDMFKIVSSVGVSEVIYMIARWLVHYQMLTLQYDPYIASIVAHIIASGIFIMALNLSVKITGLYKR